MKIWKSVVGKIWLTTLLLVCFILIFLMIFLSGYFETLYMKNAEIDARQQATKIVKVLEDSQDDSIALFLDDILPENMSMMVLSNGDLQYSTVNQQDYELLKATVSEEVMNNEGVITKEIPKGVLESGKHSILISQDFGSEHSIVIVNSLERADETIMKITNFIYIAGSFAFLLTTIFAFFLSTKISKPLKEMMEMAKRFTNGEFEQTVTFNSDDEVGELAVTLNQMGSQLQYHIGALSEEKEKLYRILSNMADGVIMFDQLGQIVVTNPPAKKLLTNLHIEDPFETPSEFVGLFKNVIEREVQQIIEIDVKDETWVIIMTPMYNNQAIGAVAVLRDMTEERKLDNMKKDFIANVSHELRTPMVMLQGYTEAMLDDIVSTEEERTELVQIVHDETLRMGRLVNELLDVARMESGKQTLKLSNVQIQDFLQRISRKFQGVVREENISLIVECEQDDLMFIFDEDSMEQVLTNLIDNGIRHTMAEGRIRVHVSHVLEGLEIVISDTGSGIEEADLPYIFDRFYKADKARTRGKAGTGLGLAIVKKIIDMHKGSIHVNSKLHIGTEFIIILPEYK